MPTKRARAKGPPPARVELAAELAEAGEHVRLEVDGDRVDLTRLDKVLWPANGRLGTPAVTRRGLLVYLLRMGDLMLEHARDRPLTLIRTPSGLGGRRFVQFHWEQKLPKFVETVSIWSEKNRQPEPFLLCNNLQTLLWLAHVGALETHVWHSRVTTAPEAEGLSTTFDASAAALKLSVLNRPDYVVFDIDPYIYSGQERPGEQPEYNLQAFERGKAVAFRLKQLLDEMKLASRVKTSGRTGLHVLLPIVRTLDYDAARAVAQTVGEHLVRMCPDEVTTEWDVTRRTGKVFFDYGMNARVKTLAAPYSVRVAPGAPVSMPLEWSALEQAKPLDFTLRNVPDLVVSAGDNWHDLLTAKQNLEAVLSIDAGGYESTSRRSPRGRPPRRSG